MPVDWENLPTEELLDVRLSDLGLTVQDTWLEDCVGASAKSSMPRGFAAFVFTLG